MTIEKTHNHTTAQTPTTTHAHEHTHTPTHAADTHTKNMCCYVSCVFVIYSSFSLFYRKFRADFSILSFLILSFYFFFFFCEVFSFEKKTKTKNFELETKN